MLIRLIVITLMFVSTAVIAEDEPRLITWVSDVRVCENDSHQPPNFSDSSCIDHPLELVDPQGRVIWLAATINLSPEVLGTGKPLVLHIGAMASSEFYWNGELVHKNGEAGASSSAEIPGKLDAAFFVPRYPLREGDNEIAIKMSSFHNPIRVVRPLHYLYLSIANPKISPLSFYYTPALLTAGVFVLAAVYFGLISLLDRRKRVTAFIALMAFFVGAQLLAEALRGFMTYDYPWQVWRLVVVNLCAAGFALSLIPYIGYRFQVKHWRVLLAFATFIIVLIITWVPGFDTKATLSLLIPSVLALLLMAKNIWKGTKGARLTAGVLAGFIVLLLIEQTSFIDRDFYLAAGVLTIVLFIDQAREMRRIQSLRQAMQGRVEQLELELLRRQIAPHFLMNTLNALTEWVESDPATGVKMIDALADEFRLLSQMSHRELVPLATEIALCRRHLEVMSYRVDRAFSLTVESVDEQLPVPPGIIHTLIENAFTHGRFADGASFKLSQERSEKRVSLILQTPPVDGQSKPNKGNSGEGLVYVRKRLAAAFGPDASLSDGPDKEGGWVSLVSFDKAPGNLA